MNLKELVRRLIGRPEPEPEPSTKDEHVTDEHVTAVRERRLRPIIAANRRVIDEIHELETIARGRR